MPTNYTPNYQLCQWERSDQVLMDDFNTDNAKIDTALAALAEADRAEAAERLALAAQVAKCGNCKIYVAPYSSNVWTDGFVPLPGRPELLFILNQDSLFLIATRYAGTATYYSSSGNDSKRVPVIWSDSGLTLGNGTHTYPNSGMYVFAFFAVS